MYAHQNDRFSVFLSHQNDRSKMIGKCREMIACAKILKFPTKMIGRPAELNFPPKWSNGKFSPPKRSPHSHTSHSLLFPYTNTSHVRRWFMSVSNEPNAVLFHFKRAHSSETKLISVPLRLPAGRRSKRPTIPDFEFVQSEGQRAPISSRKGTVSVLGLLSAAWQRTDRSGTVC